MDKEFYIKQGHENMDLNCVKELLSHTYWANKRSKETIQKSIENSLCYGAFAKEDNKQIGFARVITDYATTYYICDVIVDEKYQGLGIGKALMQEITADDRLQAMVGMLLTKSAHGLYQQFGFRQVDGIYMDKR